MDNQEHIVFYSEMGEVVATVWPTIKNNLDAFKIAKVGDIETPFSENFVKRFPPRKPVWTISPEYKAVRTLGFEWEIKRIGLHSKITFDCDLNGKYNKAKFSNSFDIVEVL